MHARSKTKHLRHCQRSVMMTTGNPLSVAMLIITFFDVLNNKVTSSFTYVNNAVRLTWILNASPICEVNKGFCSNIVGAHGSKFWRYIVDTSCYFWLSCISLNFKPSRIIFQRATLSNQCTLLRKLRLYPGP